MVGIDFFLFMDFILEEKCAWLGMELSQSHGNLENYNIEPLNK